MPPPFTNLRLLLLLLVLRLLLLLVGVDEGLVVEVEHDAAAGRLLGRGALRDAVHPQRLAVHLDRHLPHLKLSHDSHLVFTDLLKPFIEPS